LIARESDTDKDRMISYDEFLAETKRDEFEKASKKTRRIQNWSTVVIRKQCCGSGMFIPNPNLFHHGSTVKKIPRSGI
jgi:hypothetical protein